MLQTELNGIRCLTIVLTFHWVTGQLRWTAGTRNDRYEDQQNDFEFDHHYRIQVSHAGKIIDSTVTQSGRYGNIEVTVNAFRETFVLDLKLNTYLFASTYVEKTVTESGTTYHDVNHKENHCYYTGTVRDQEQSNAAVSTCKGIVGYFAVGNISYHIEPRSGRLRGPHVVYRSRGKSKTTYGCGTEHIVLKNLMNSANSELRLKRSFQWPQDQDKKDKVVEVYLASDKSQFDARGSDSNAVFQRAKDIINIASSSYQPLGIYLVLVGMEVWTTNPFAVTDSDVDTTLQNWYSFRKTKINPSHYNDNAVLLTNTRFYKGVIGKAIIGSMCSNQYSGAIISDLNSSPAVAGSTVAHEMGHNFGLIHDGDSCSCVDRGGHCIMFASSNPSIPATNWSSCSKEQFQTAFQQGRDICLYDVPRTLYEPTVTRCGNGIVEEGEECDCGRAPSLECNSACCNATTCKLTATSTCSAGKCCDVSNCQVRSYGTVCRQKSEDCDLTEYCDGQQAQCPQDTHKRDGTNCTVNGDNAYCYDGQCRSHKTQCQLIWGPGTPVSDPVCYHQFNTNGLHYGNCGMNWLPNNVSYIPCDKSDVMCGKLLCDNTGKGLSKYTDYYLLSSASISSFQCNSVIFDFGLRTQDPGLVPNGASCGDGKMCMAQKCVTTDSQLSKVPCERTCSSSEECNNQGICQNLTGPTASQGTTSQPVIMTSPFLSASSKALIIGLCILFLLILPLIVIGAIVAYRYRYEIEECFGNVTPVKRRRGQPPVPTISGSTDQQVFSNQYLQPNSHGMQPTRSAPPRPPPASYRTQVPSVSRAHPVIPYGYENDGAVLSPAELTLSEQNSYNVALQQARAFHQAPTNRTGRDGRPAPPVKPSGLRQGQARERPQPPPRPTNGFGGGNAAPYSHYEE